MASINEITATESDEDNGLGLCPVCKKGGKALMTYDPEGSSYCCMCCPSCKTKWQPCDRYGFNEAVNKENVGIIRECSWVLPEYGEGHSEEPLRDESAMFSRVGEMIETLIVLENRGQSIGECASRYLVILKEWRKEALEREARRSACFDERRALDLLEGIRSWLLTEQRRLTFDNDIPF